MSQSKSQARLRQAGRAFAGTAQGPQRSPQVLTPVSSAQTEPHWWKPARHASPQTPPEQVAVPFIAVGHAVQRVPQVAMSSLDAQVSPQRWKPVGQAPASGRTRSHRLSAQVSASSQARQKRPPVPQAALSLPGRHSPADVQQPSGQVVALQGGFSCGQPANRSASSRSGIERTTTAFHGEVGPACLA